MLWKKKNKKNKDVTIYCFFVVDNIYIEVDERYKDLKDAFVIGVSWWGLYEGVIL